MDAQRKQLHRKVLAVFALLCLLTLGTCAIVQDKQIAEQEITITKQENEIKELRSNLYMASYEIDLLQEAAQSRRVPEELVPDEAAPQATFTEEELDYVARLVVNECGAEPYEGQLAVAQCVYDRYAAGYADTVKGVIDARGQFATPRSGDISDWPNSRKAVDEVFLDGKRVFDEDVIFFYNPKASTQSNVDWLETKPYIGQIGNHVFRGN